MTKKVQSESSFQRRVIRDLKSLKNTWFYKAADRAKKGIPDFLLCINGEFFGVEIKRPGGKATPLQLHTLGLIETAGGEVFIVEPKDWPTVLLYLARAAKDND